MYSSLIIFPVSTNRLKYINPIKTNATRIPIPGPTILQKFEEFEPLEIICLEQVPATGTNPLPQSLNVACI